MYKWLISLIIVMGDVVMARYDRRDPRSSDAIVHYSYRFITISYMYPVQNVTSAIDGQL